VSLDAAWTTSGLKSFDLCYAADSSRSEIQMRVVGDEMLMGFAERGELRLDLGEAVSVFQAPRRRGSGEAR